MHNSLVKDLSLLFFLAIMWSASFTVIKISGETIPPATLSLLRVFAGALLLYGWLKFKRESLPTEPRLWVTFFLIGLIGNAIPFTLINWGEQQIPSGLAAILIAVMPLAALLLGRLFSDEILNARRIIGVSIGFAGVIFLIGPEALLSLGDEALRQLAVSCAAIFYAISAIMIRKLPKATTAQHGAGVLIASTLVLLPLSIVMDDPWALDYTAQAIVGAIYLGIFPTALATLILIVVINSRGVTFLSLNSYIIPVMGISWGFIFLGEPITSTIVWALAMILLGIAVAGGGPATRKQLK